MNLNEAWVMDAPERFRCFLDYLCGLRASAAHLRDANVGRDPGWKVVDLCSGSAVQTTCTEVLRRSDKGKRRQTAKRYCF